MRTCHGCATDYPDGAAYCPRCGLGAGEMLPALPEPQTFRIGPAARQVRTTSAEIDDDHGEELLDARRHGRRGPVLFVAAAVVVGGVALGIWLGGGSSGNGQSSSDLASIAAEHGGASVPVTVPPATKPPPHIDLVGVAPAVAHVRGLTEVRNVLTDYFTAINDHNDYAGWAATLVPYKDPPRPNRRQYDGYATTHDSNISINSLRSPGGGQWQVSVSFTSRQNPKFANGNDCLNWSIRYTLRPSKGSLRIDTVHSSTLNSLSC